MKFATQKHPAELALQQIEEILSKNDMSIYIDPYSGLNIMYKQMDFTIRENGNDERTGCRQLPREIGEERLFLLNPQILENKLAGWSKV